ncbi:hypothetical protein [Streptomyces uncialis]|uniref:hypothetical protein n=1 Tax=Streptomyces uncialis TaxID=1048205 RepID=UPI00224E9682|nr:hypothetical protein [Streptomyces uncialis]MCX4659122.1 hypothetical protein [Streptomyces uncialis]
MGRARWAAAVAVAVVVVGAAGCGTGGSGAGAAVTPAPPRPKGTGPLPREVVRADLDTSAADADVPANEEFARDAAGVRPGTAASCSVALKAWTTDTTATPVDIARYDAAVRELRERDWRTHDQRVRKTPDGETEYARMILKQRGWTLFTEFIGPGHDGQISLRAFEDACMKKVGAGMDQVA